jgi:uncharacterized DUF497 family protein
MSESGPFRVLWWSVCIAPLAKVVFALSSNVRIISARRATTTETRAHETYLN